MMNLDDLILMKKIDPGNYYANLSRRSEDALYGWSEGEKSDTLNTSKVTNILIKGTGILNLAAEMFVEYASPLMKIPVKIWNKNLSESTPRETTLVLLLTDGKPCPEIGPLETKSQEQECQIIRWNSREANVIEAISFLLGLFSKYGLIPDQKDEFMKAIDQLSVNWNLIKIDVPVVNNPAKRQSGQLMDRWVYIIASDNLDPVGRYWKYQINLMAKSWAHYENINTAIHSSIEGICHPGWAGTKTIVLFLDGGCLSPESRSQTQLVRQNFMVEGINTDIFLAKGNHPLSQIFTSIQFGDMLAYYLAMANQTDPGATPQRDQIQSFLGS